VVPTRAEIDRTLAALRGSVAGCTQVHDVAALQLTFRGSTGRVSAVVVDGRFAGTTAGACMASAVRDVHVEPFAQPSFSYVYRYRL
jgi:hypothetical protein